MAAPHDPKKKQDDTAPPAEGWDQLSPAKIVRDRQLTSQSERVGDNTPTGPAHSPPVDIDAV